MKKKAQSLSLRTVIVAALGLIVLIVLIFIFTNKSTGFLQGTKDCASKKGECFGSGDLENGKCPGEYIAIPDSDCPERTGDDEAKCCVKLIGTSEN